MINGPHAQPTTEPIGGLSFRSELQLIVRSKHSLVFIDSLEEERIEALTVDVARSLGRPLYTWSLTRGLGVHGSRELHDDTRQPEDALSTIRQTAQQGIYLMWDLGPSITEPLVQRLLRDIARHDDVTLLITGDVETMPDALRVISETFTLPLPDATLISQRVRSLMVQLATRGRVRNELTEEQMQQLILGLRGLTMDEIDSVLLRLIEEDGRLSIEDLATALSSKSRMLARSGVVELVTADVGMEWVAGFEHLKAWAELRRRAFDGAAQTYGLDTPKGVLLTGVPGCGKSMVVKAMAREWNMPLVRLDAGALFDKYVGSTEKNLRSALATAEALAPSILWIDEIEKGFASTGPSDTDGGLGYRLIGSLATWMQERTVPVFLAATSNDITLLPPELTRQGRFDETFFVDLPTPDERAHLFALQLARRGRDHARFDCVALGECAQGFSGSEVEQAVANALYRAFAESRDVEMRDVTAEIAATRPLSVVARERIDRIRAWGREHARQA